MGGSLGVGQTLASSQLAGESALAQAQLAAKRLSARTPRRVGSTGILHQADGGPPKHATRAAPPGLEGHLQAPEPVASVKGPSKPTPCGSTLDKASVNKS